MVALLGAATVVGLSAAGLLLARTLLDDATDAGPARYVRVNQVGYDLAGPMTAFLVGTERDAGARFSVVDGAGREAYAGRVGASLGGWNRRYNAIYPIDVGSLRPGVYRIVASGPGDTAATPSAGHASGLASAHAPGRFRAVSAPFRIAAASDLYAPVAAEMIRFFQVQRDGADLVASVPYRRPSHLADGAAEVYAADPNGSPRRVGGTADVSGGWFDAGDYLKFTATTSYALANLLTASRAGGTGRTPAADQAPAAGRTPDDQALDDQALDAEIDHGLEWLDRMWDESSGVLYAQVGIGESNEAAIGDHDVWRLPESDDALAVSPADRRYRLRHRPVLRANEPGAPVSPNLAGRVTAAFALAAQVHAASDPARARVELARAASVYARSDTTGAGGRLVTSYPAEYYPETSWADDMEYGATELALAARMLSDQRADGWLDEAAGWARRYLLGDSRESVNLYDVGSLAHLDLAAALAASGRLPDLSAELVRDVEARLDEAVSRAADDPFRAGVRLPSGDVTSHVFGLVTTAVRYRQVTGDASYHRFAGEQAAWVLGGNPWGTSMIVGVGAVYPRCPHHQIANLSREPLIGAAVNGPAAEHAFAPDRDPDRGSGADADPDGLAGRRACPGDGSDRFLAMTGNGTRYRDDVRAWQSAEPAIDTTSAGLLALTLLARG